MCIHIRTYIHTHDKGTHKHLVTSREVSLEVDQNLDNISVTLSCREEQRRFARAFL